MITDCSIFSVSMLTECEQDKSSEYDIYELSRFMTVYERRSVGFVGLN